MSANGYAIQHGPPGRSNGPHAQNMSKRTRMRPPTVEEALPFSPFSSVVPFNSDIIPTPSIGLRASASLFPTAEERTEAREGLECLNREAANKHQPSPRLQQNLEDIRQLLKADNVPKYKFRTAPKLRRNHESDNNGPALSLTPFSQMVYDATSIDFTYPTPEEPSPRAANGKAGSQKQKSPAKVKSQQAHRAAATQQTYDSNSTIMVEIPATLPKIHPQAQASQIARKSSVTKAVTPSKPTDHRPIPSPHHSTPQQANQNNIQASPRTPKRAHAQEIVGPKNTPVSASKLSIVLPDLPADFRREDYAVLPDSPDTPQYISKKRRTDDGSDEDVVLSLDQREKADLALQALREYLQDIFEAENQLQVDISAFTNIFMTSNEGLRLTVAAQTKVESLLQKTISLGRFSNLNLDDLLRLQRICEPPIKDSEGLDMKVDETIGESEVDALMQQITVMELGLKSARTSLRLMAGGREDKQLYSEDVIHSALNAFKSATENCIIPIVEMRGSGSSAASFKLFLAQKKILTNLLTQSRRVLSLLLKLVAEIELSETVINTLEFIACRLIFVENAPTEKDSILGVSMFDRLREVAMGVLCEIFWNYPPQRQGIFDEILTSLEKLPVTRQSARQFKLADGKSIQLVSALIIRLIQTSARRADDPKDKEKRRSKALEAINDGGDEDELNGDSDVKPAASGQPTINSELRAEEQAVTAIQELRGVVSPLLDTAKSNASYVVAFIVNRAMNSTKTGDAPYRNLLDLFVEDFITCLNSAEWPAAELLLRLFLFKMVHLAEGEKIPSPAKTMALELLGLMGAAISDTVSHVRKLASSLENGDADLGKYLSRLAEAALEKKAPPADLVSWERGPYRSTLESLNARCLIDTQLSSAVGFYTAEWASKVCTTYDLLDEEDAEADFRKVTAEHGRLAYRLRMMVTDNRWLTTEYRFDSVPPSQSRLAYAITLLHSQFCESFGRILTILLGSMASEQATVRSKSLKSVNQVLETDPSILDREPAVKLLLLRCSNDPSVLVRDSALGLIGKCISLRPSLEDEMIPSILQRVNDSGVGVRKRAMKLSKDIYLRNTNGDVRSAIADALLHRVADLDEGVQEIARQSIEEVWMSPFYEPTSTDNTSAQFKLAMADHGALMVKTVQRGSGVASVLDKVLQSMLSDESKFSSANFLVCKALVATMFETIIDNPTSDKGNAPSARDAMQVLMIFAKSNPKLFTPEQIQLLQPYVANVGGGDDLAIYRSVVVIFRHVLPQLSKIHNSFLAAVRKELIPAVSRMPKAILDDVVACLWIISGVLDDFQHLTRLVLSTLTGIHKMRNANLNDPSKADLVRKVSKLLLISGMCGKHCDLDPQSESFREGFPNWKGNSVAKLMSDTFAPYASPDQHLDVRKAAFDAIGMVCQSWPKNFTSANISTSFKEVFSAQTSVLETIIMKSFKDFLLLEEKRSETGDDSTVGGAADPKAKLGVMGGGQGDGVAIGIAQLFLKDFTRIALASQDDQALLATELIVSITRQGLVHPKECGPPLIILETSQNPKIAELAFHAHRALHEKHETIIEREYMPAVYMAYKYQRDIVKDIHGATLNPFASKLHMLIDVLKISKSKNRKRLFENLCARIDFDPAKMDIEQLPHHLEFSQFIIENMAFFEFVSVDDLLTAIVAMERIVAGTGTGIAHSIDTEIFHVSLTQSSEVNEQGEQQRLQPSVDQTRLLQLTASSMMLACLWETRSHLRRQYGLTTARRDGKGKAAPKDLNRAPMKVPFVTADKFWENVTSIMSSLESEEKMLKQCRDFVTLLSVDAEFKIATEGDDDAERAEPGTPSGDEDNGAMGPPGSGRGRKRKASSTPGGRKKRARSSSVSRRAKGKGSRKRASVDSDDDNDDSEGWE